MIRVLQKRDIDRIADIWLECNRKAHAFIPADYWRQNFDMVKAMLPQAEVYVYDNDRNRRQNQLIKENRASIE